MKKVLGIVLIAGSLVACNNSSDTTSTSDSTKTKDSINTMNTTSGDTSNRMKTDTTTGKMGADSTHKADSTRK